MVFILKFFLIRIGFSKNPSLVNFRLILEYLQYHIVWVNNIIPGVVVENRFLTI